nr:MAG TPA: hypothetical protein [Caudoviricetes sp.]
MARELMIYCVEGGVGHDAYVSGKSYPADEVLSNMHFREMNTRCLYGSGALMELR